MGDYMAYVILVFYGLLAICCATLGHYFDKKDGFSTGYIFGALISIVLWITVGRKAAKM